MAAERALCRPHLGAPVRVGRPAGLGGVGRARCVSGWSPLPGTSAVGCMGTRSTSWDKMRAWDQPRGSRVPALTRCSSVEFDGSPVRWPSSPVRPLIQASAGPAPSAWRERARRWSSTGATRIGSSSTEAAFRAEGFNAVGVVGSMDTEEGVAVLTDRAMDAFGRIDLIVSTVGGAPYPLSFDAISEAQLLETIRLNTWPAVALIRAALEPRPR